jgi:ABC-type branched-subunit amino acid transport system substrate-binding protein
VVGYGRGGHGARARYAVAAALASVAAFAALGAVGQAAASKPGKRASPQITATVVLDHPGTSPFSQQNLSLENGVAVAVDELDAQRGSRVRIKLVTKTLDGLSAAAVRQKLRAAGATALILPCDTDSQYPLAAAAAGSGVLMLAPCDPEPSAGQRYANYWAVGMGANAEAAAIAHYMVYDRSSQYTGPTRIFVVTSPSPRYVGLLTGYFRKAAPAQHVTIVGSATIPLGTHSFSALARKITAANATQGIFTALPPPYVDALVAGLEANGVTPQVFGTTVMDTPLTLSNKFPPGQSVAFSSYGFPQAGAAASRFESDYQRHVGQSPIGGFPGLGLETIRLYTEAVERGRSASPTAVSAALLAGLALPGVGLAERTYTRDGDHNPLAAVGISEDLAGSITGAYASIPTNVPLP